MNKESAYFAARHAHPEIIRLARAALDVGVSVDVVLTAAHNDTIRDAIEYMSDHPAAGRVVWVDARRYTWKDLQEFA